MRGMLALRAFNMTSNVAFIIYGTYLDTMPMIVLHSILLPLNTFHLCMKLRTKLGTDNQDNILIATSVEKIPAVPAVGVSH